MCLLVLDRTLNKPLGALTSHVCILINFCRVWDGRSWNQMTAALFCYFLLQLYSQLQQKHSVMALGSERATVDPLSQVDSGRTQKLANLSQDSGAMSQQLLYRALVSAKWLSEAIKSQQAGLALRIVDASWYLPKMKRDPKREFEERHIPGAVFFDIDQCSDRTSPYDHMLPKANDFAEYVGKLGVGNDSHVVVYDGSDQGLFSAPRVWWMFRVFGHEAVSLLDGGLKNWQREGNALSSGKTQVAPSEFHASLDKSLVKTYEDVLDNLDSRHFQLVDARAAGRFRGVEPEPRDGIEPGHVPGSTSIPFTDFLIESGLEKTPEQIRTLFQEKKVDLLKPVVATCGSGVTACHVALGAYLCGKPDVAVYDGAWVEWYMRAQPENIISEGKGKTV
ncbi:3-mercaptopyruvate sulfurtransferase isoform X1 [Onychostruthus taczanowskii]|uniref:3-mercaptopyruvate sulfurtransferase isoform X1 n=3 Tax=Onychostruthus taczanowskii TaxID=356909 RepID=UPI001B8082D9|nr:3-mercaptopyruvate sulfurtransferase isoform X1 [Onychostruthus taczanowskii]